MKSLKQWIKKKLYLLITWVLGGDLAWMQKNIKNNKEAMDSLHRLINEGVLAIDCHVRSDSWVIVGMRGKEGKPDFVRIYPQRLETVVEINNWLRQMERDNKNRVIVDAPMHMFNHRW